MAHSISRKSRPNRPTALTIAGSDSGGGAGIQTDLKTFESLEVHGTCAITCVTAQNPKGVSAIQPCRPDIVRSQMEAVFAAFHPSAVKTGMLYSKAIIRSVAEFFRQTKVATLIVDPVMVATSGARLLQPSAIAILRTELLPLASLVTPNVSEAELLTGRRIRQPEDLRSAARAIHEQAGCAVLMKGGHLKSLDEAIDIYYDGETELLLRAPYIKGFSTHGTGCTYSAAITGFAARGCDLVQAVQFAKAYITQSIVRSVQVAGHTILFHPRSRNAIC